MNNKDYTKLNLSSGEHVEFAFHRVTICLVMIWLCVAVCMALIFIITTFASSYLPYLDDMGNNFLTILSFAFYAVILVSGIIATIIHYSNKIFITNHRVIQFSMISIFSTSYNTVDLSSIEDASFHQENIIQQLCNFGTLRLATVGDETTYTLRYTTVTPEILTAITRLVSADKDNAKA